MRVSALVLVLCVTLTVNGYSYLREFFGCRMRDGQVGICTGFHNCYSAMLEVKRSRFPEMCGFYGPYPIVCCTQQSSPAAQRAKEISLRKCEEYAKISYDVQIMDYVPGTAQMYLGQLTSIDEFPYMTALGLRNGSEIEWRCGGSLISDEFVLTAAHCVYGIISSEIVVRLGTDALDFDNSFAEDFGVGNIYIHPRYKRSSKYHDIALLELDRMVMANIAKVPVCLSVMQKLTGRTVKAIGFGATKFLGKMSKSLREGSMDIISAKRCGKMYRKGPNLKKGIVDKYMVCAFGKWHWIGSLWSPGPDTCQGDSGGPLLIRNNDHDEIVGITSFGRGCGLTAGVYTRIYPYIPWIENIVWPIG